MNKQEQVRLLLGLLEMATTFEAAAKSSRVSLGEEIIVIQNARDAAKYWGDFKTKIKKIIEEQSDDR